MTDPLVPEPKGPRWEYKILWRYGAHLLVGTGLLAMGFGASGVCGTAISLSLLPIGFVSLVSGIVLPRIEGKFSAGPSGLTADMLAVHHLDQPRFVASGPAVAGSENNAPDGSSSMPDSPRVTTGDVWDALEEAGLRPDGVGMGHAYFRLRGARTLDMPNRGFKDWATASSDLLGVLAGWGIHPVASGMYPVPEGVAPDYAKGQSGRFMNLPTRE